MAIFQNKILLLVVGGIALAGIVWYSFLRDTSTDILQTEDLTAATEVDGDIVDTLLQLRAVSLAGTIFSDPSFQQLKDFSTPITPEPVGRPNPFAPLEMRLAATTTVNIPQIGPRSTSTAPAATSSATTTQP